MPVIKRVAGSSELANRLTSTAYKDIGTASADATTYTINDLNQYASRTNARGLIISGMAPQDQPVMLTVKTDLNLATPNTALNNQPAERQGTLFARRIAFTSTAEWAKIDINATGGDPSRTARTLGNRWVPPQTEAMTYDADGNLTGDARWIYRWDGEGRLSELETKSTAGAVGLPMVKLVFGYDAGSRRVMKRGYANVGGTTTAPIWVLQNDVRFVYVGWHMIAEVEIKGTASDAPAGGGANPPPFLRRSWLWGEDLTGTAPAAVGDQRKLGAGGGVGGLLAMTRHARGDQPAESYWATSDLNGNVIGLLATSSTKTAVYDYDPFGQPIRVNEPEAGLNPVRFSSKYTDAETGLCYYGYRYYSPEMGRWLGRDPIGERGGLNLYGMLGNGAIALFDRLGLEMDPLFYDFPPLDSLPPPGIPDHRADWEETIANFGNVAGGLPRRMLHHWFYGGGRDYWLTENDFHLCVKSQHADLMRSEKFKEDLGKYMKSDGYFEGEYRSVTDSAVARTLGNFQLIMKVTVTCHPRGWHAVGTIEGDREGMRYDFNPGNRPDESEVTMMRWFSYLVLGPKDYDVYVRPIKFEQTAGDSWGSVDWKSRAVWK